MGNSKTSVLQAIELTQLATPEISTRLDASIDGTSSLVVRGEDTGPSVQMVWGTSHYDYWLKVEGGFKDSVLLWLLKERFNGGNGFRSDAEFREWLLQKGIPCSFGSRNKEELQP